MEKLDLSPFKKTCLIFQRDLAIMKHVNAESNELFVTNFKRKTLYQRNVSRSYYPILMIPPTCSVDNILRTRKSI